VVSEYPHSRVKLEFQDVTLASVPRSCFLADMKRFLVGLLCITLVFIIATSSMAGEYLVFFGTYTGAKSKGIYVSRFDDQTGKLSEPQLAAETKNPSFLALHPNGNLLFAVGESSSIGTNRQGAVSSFAIDRTTGKLALINSQRSGGGGPCHLTVDSRHRSILVANYGTGSLAAFPIGSDGQLSEPVCVIQHDGSSVNPQRQAGPHAHCIVLDPSNRFALACDLGTDKVMVYRTGDGTNALIANDPAFAKVSPGAGPRHLVFEPHGKFVFVVNEMSSSVTTFSWDGKRGALRELDTVSTLPEGFIGKSTCAEIAVRTTGTFVYASNRGHDSIAVFGVGETGKLSLIQHVPTGGKTPRHFALDPPGRWLLAENQGSDSVVVFRLDPQSGRLEMTGHKIEVPSPVCAVFLPVKR
jgi:6-phosphogluconolactonase